MQASLLDRLFDELKEPVEAADWAGPETSTLLVMTVAIALGAALLFGAGSMLVTTGPMTEFSGVTPELDARQLL